MNEPIYHFLESYLPALLGGAVVELGAHKGADTRWMLDRLKGWFTYIAVEPDPRNYAVLFDFAHALEQVYLVGAAVGAVDRVETFYLSEGEDRNGTQHTDSSSLKEPGGIVHRYPWMTFRSSRVQVYRLDTITAFYKLRVIDFVWADIQGAEIEMIAGGQKSLAATKFLYTECYERPVLYKGQPTLDEIARALPGKWRIVLRTATDVLLENQSFRPMD